jgi:uncharacterized protein YndB with AHSA1/START domain
MMDQIVSAPAPAVVSAVGERESRIERFFNAKRERVWQAMTEPELIVQWWGRGNRVVIERFEFVRGGHWRFVEHSDHGVHGFEGRYREIVPIERTVSSFEWDGMPAHVAIQTMTLEQLADGRTKLVCTALFHTTAERDGMLNSGMEGGANLSYRALDRVLAALG